MFDIDKYMHKPFFERECRPEPPCSFGPPHDKPRYTMTEEVEHTARLMRETIDRLLKFEERAKCELSDLSKNVMSDNVIFKNAMHESWTTFLMEVKNEINVFEANMESDVAMFKAEIESNYATLSEDVHNQIAENLATFEQKVADFEAKYEKEFTDLTSSIQEQYNAFVASINQRIDNYNENTAQAFADFKRQMQTQLNTFEQTMETNYATFTESVGNSIHEFRTNWEQIITERLAEQDGRISDAEMYMKTNLEHHVETLIGDMHANGEFIDIIEGEVFNDLESKSKLEYHHATTALGANVCAEFAKANKRTFYVPYGEVLEITETLDLTGLDVEINGEIKVAFNGVGVIVGDISNSSEARNIHIRNVYHTNYKDGDISVRVQGVMNANVNIGSAKVVQFYADGDSDHDAIAYSTFHVGKCDVMQITDKADTDNIGWINENTFVNCRVMVKFSIEGNTYAHNNNVFIKPCFEGADMVLSKCQRNKFYDLRSEGDFTLTLEEDTNNNYVCMNYYYDNFTYLAGLVTDNGVSNIVTTSHMADLDKVMFYNVNANTLEKELYDVEGKANMTANDGTFTVPAWARFVEEKVVPVDGISALWIKTDAKNMRVTVAPLDVNKVVMENDPLVYVGLKEQDGDGVYNPGGNINEAFVLIKNPDVKYLRISITNGGVQAEYKYVTGYAYFSPRNFPLAGFIGDYFKK